MKNISSQSKSFIVLFAIAVIGSYLCIMLWNNLTNKNVYKALPQIGITNSETEKLFDNTPDPVDTSKWLTYTDTKNGLSFKYSPDWKIKPGGVKNNYTILEIDPGAKFYNIKIYISPDNYYVMEGLPTKSDTVGGQPALNMSNMLFGVKNNNKFYTFDVGLSVSLTPAFYAMVQSVQFIQ